MEKGRRKLRVKSYVEIGRAREVYLATGVCLCPPFAELKSREKKTRKKAYRGSGFADLEDGRCPRLGPVPEGNSAKEEWGQGCEPNPTPRNPG